MKGTNLLLSFGGAFALGSIIATAIGLTLVLPAAREAWQVNIDSDAYRGIQGAMVEVEQSAVEGDCEKAAAQLKVFNDRFAEYREGGPIPADWYQDVISAQPARSEQ